MLMRADFFSKLPQAATRTDMAIKGKVFFMLFLFRSKWFLVKAAFRMRYFSVFTHESFNVTVRLNTGAPVFVSTRSATK